jgi:hypothetical protein
MLSNLKNASEWVQDQANFFNVLQKPQHVLIKNNPIMQMIYM